MTETPSEYELADYDITKIADALAEATMPPLRQPGDLTVEDYRKAVERKRKVRLTYRQAEYRLSRLADGQQMEKLRVWDPLLKRECTVFRPIEGVELDRS